MKQQHSFEWWCGICGSVLSVIGIVTDILFIWDVIQSLAVGVTGAGITIGGILLLLVSIKKNVEDLASLGRKYQNEYHDLKIHSDFKKK